MANDPLQPPVPSATLLLIGPILIGSLLSFMLFGISIVQLYIYHVSFPRDRPVLKMSVYCIFALDIFQSVVVGSEAWDTLCAGWGRPINLRFPNWSFYILPMISGFIAGWVQIFYAWRIHRLGKWMIIPCIIVFFSLMQTGASWAITISFSLFKDIEHLHDKNMYARTIIWLGGAALVDVTIMLSMVYLLYSVKHRTSTFERTDLLVNRLLRLTMETGSACALSAILELSFFLGLPDTNVHFIVAMMLSKVYSNTLMVSLNSRARLEKPSTAQRTYSSIGFNNFPMLSTEESNPQMPLPSAQHLTPSRRSIMADHGLHLVDHEMAQPFHRLNSSDIELKDMKFGDAPNTGWTS